MLDWCLLVTLQIGTAIYDIYPSTTHFKYIIHDDIPAHLHFIPSICSGSTFSPPQSHISFTSSLFPSCLTGVLSLQYYNHTSRNSSQSIHTQNAILAIIELIIFLPYANFVDRHSLETTLRSLSSSDSSTSNYILVQAVVGLASSGLLRCKLLNTHQEHVGNKIKAPKANSMYSLRIH